MRIILPRALLLLVAGLAGVALAPAGRQVAGGVAGLLAAFGALALGEAVRRLAPRQALGAGLGAGAGALVALATGSLALPAMSPDWQLLGAVLLALCLIAAGALAGTRAIAGFNFGIGASVAGGVDTEVPGRGVAASKILDTSVIIDGRLVHVIEAGFIEGTLVIPQFILRELQQVADSSDPLKRNRGRKGLDVLRAVQASDRVRVAIVADDSPDVREVDAKLLWLAEKTCARVLTNDYNLNKIAQVRGIGVMNINDLANAMKPVVLPGETLGLQVIKEGKERNQGVGYLDDGTMVVVDNGRRLIGQKVDVVVTSVIQTNAGKMIFGSAEDDIDEIEVRPRIVRRPQEAGASVVSPPPTAAAGSTAPN